MLLLGFGGSAPAQPADCAVEASAPATMPLWVDLQGLPGVTPVRTGSVGFNVPISAPGMACADPGPGPSPGRDTLAGPPGGVLQGPPSRDLLRGSTPRIEIQTR